jgi:NAD+ kinase
MRVAKPPRVALFLKRTSWQVFVEEGEDPRVRELLAEGDVTVARLRASHDEHERSVAEVRAALDALGAEVELIEHRRESFDIAGFDLVVTVGGDGTLLHASHHVVDIPVLGINSAPSHSVGFFCGATSGEAHRAIASALRGTLEATTLTRMKVLVNGAVVASSVLNDALFCHASPAATTRYILELTRGATGKTVVEEQKSSGCWVGPAAGSTAAQRSAGGRVLPLTSEDLQFVVREAYMPRGEQYRLRRALVSPGDKLVIRSKMLQAKIFFDGPERYVDVLRGDVIEFTRSTRALTLLGIAGRERS